MRLVLTHWAGHVALAMVAAAGVSLTLGLIVHDLRTVAPDELAWQQLAQRPRTAAVEQRNQQIAGAIRDALSDQVQVYNWTLLVPPTYARCAGEAGTIGGGNAARAVIGGTWTGDAVPRRQWSAAYQAIQNVLGADGFTSVDVLLDGPAEHRISIDDSQGTTLTFDLDRQGTSFSLESECRLVPEAKAPVM
jgi:hypothetical protein